jgi:hypothetical protein
MNTVFLLFSLCTAPDCLDRTVFVMDQFQSVEIADSYADCIEARNKGRRQLAKVSAGGVRVLECRTQSQLDRMGAGK